MIILLSPSKTLDMDAAAPALPFTQPQFLAQSKQLIAHARKLSIAEITSLMDVSEKLATLNHERFAHFTTPFTPANATPAIAAFQGDVYDGLAAHTWSQDNHAYAQDHLRILSGLYGLLRPLDLMQAYRLEMKLPFATQHAKNLYGFWGTQLRDAIDAQDQPLVVNLASEEYAKAAKLPTLRTPVMTPIFKESKNGTFKTIGIMAKKARGRMASWLIHNQISTAADITAFTLDDYRYAHDLSDDAQMIFIR